MTTPTVYLSPISLIVQYLTNLGYMAAGGAVYTYVAGTTTPATTYTDSTGTVVNANPMTLSSTGRPVSASGAPVAFWTLPGVALKVIVNDSLGNQLVYLDQIQAVNDLTNSSTSLQSLLASASSSSTGGSGPVAGADLVANAVKSYDIFSDVRAANAPVLATGQTLNILVQGGTTVGDGLGGEFFWVPGSFGVDDGRTILKPNSLLTSNSGRWIRLYGLGVPVVLVKTAAQQVVSSTTLVSDTTLTASLVAGTYLISGRLILVGSGGTGGGYKVQQTFSGSTGSALLQGGAGVSTANGTAGAIAPVLNSAITAAAISATNGDAFNFDMVLVVTALGTFTIQFAQNSSSANPTIMQPGSTLTYTRIA